MNTQNIDRLAHKPSRVIQSDLNGVDYHNYYEIVWDGPNSDFGSFRVARLSSNIGQGKRQVINVLKAAYANVTIKSFNDAVALAKQTGVRIIHVQTVRGQGTTYTYLA